jgi:Flp pilus assembly protein CpaB
MKPGERAISINVNAQSATAGFVLPGSRVDIFVTMRAGEASSKLILQNILVLAADQQTQRNPEQPSYLSQTVTLAANLQEVARLRLAQSQGELSLALRPVGDTERVKRVVAKVADLDKPIRYKGEKEEAEERPESSGTVKVPTELPEAPVPVPPKIEETPKKVVKKKKHIMLVRSGPKTEKAVFRLGAKPHDDEDEEDEDGETSDTPKPEKKAEKKAEEKKPEEKKSEKKPAAPPSAFGPRSTRTKWLR